MMGIIKALKMLPEHVPSGCMYAHALGLFSNDDPVLTLTIFMRESNLFPYASLWVTAYTALSAHVGPSLF